MALHTGDPLLNTNNGLHAAAASAVGSGTKRKRGGSKAKGWWKQPWQIDSLLLDTEALLTALETGHSSFSAFLSATEV